MYIEHSAKGSTWKNHKYIRIENGRYIYPFKHRNPSGNFIRKTANIAGRTNYLIGQPTKKRIAKKVKRAKDRLEVKKSMALWDLQQSVKKVRNLNLDDAFEKLKPDGR